MYSVTEFEESIDKFLDFVNGKIPTEIGSDSIVEWAEEKRVLPRGLTPYPGPMSFDLFPFWREPCEKLSPSAFEKEICVMKGTQIAYSTMVPENWMGFTIDVSPSAFLNLTGDADMSDMQVKLKLDALIAQCGIGHKIAAQNVRVKQRKTGDSTKLKEFDGGFIASSGPRSATKLRQMSYPRINADEFESYPKNVGGEGSIRFFIKARTHGYDLNYKILWGSTPKLRTSSNVEPIFLEGDQRRYFVPCKKCGFYQILSWPKIKFDRKEDGTLAVTYNAHGQITHTTVYMECANPKCIYRIPNIDKDYFLPKGGWRPTATSIDPFLISYHAPGLLSPVGFRPWESIASEFVMIEKRGGDPLERQVWQNTALGETFLDVGEKPKLESIIVRPREYHIDTLPSYAKPLCLFVTADVQKNRIEAEVIAYCRNAESFSVNYYVFDGDTEDINSNAYGKLRECIESSHAGMQVTMSAIDSKYRTAQVYQFCEQFESGVHPILGFETLEKGNYIRFKRVAGLSPIRFDFNTDILKQVFYTYINKTKLMDGTIPIGLCHFPKEYDRKHYLKLISESRIFKDGKWQWAKEQTRNEQLDVRVYSIGLLHALKEYYRDIEQVEDLPWDVFWDILEEENNGKEK